MTAFVDWRGLRSAILGDVEPAATRKFTTPLRGSEVRVTLDGSSSGAPVRVGPPGDYDTRRAAIPVAAAGSAYATVYPFDTFEWEIRPNRTIVYQRVPPP